MVMVIARLYPLPPLSLPLYLHLPSGYHQALATARRLRRTCDPLTIQRADSIAPPPFSTTELERIHRGDGYDKPNDVLDAVVGYVVGWVVGWVMVMQGFSTNVVLFGHIRGGCHPMSMSMALKHVPYARTPGECAVLEGTSHGHELSALSVVAH